MKHIQSSEISGLLSVLLFSLLCLSNSVHAQQEVERIRDRDGVYFAPGVTISYTKIPGIPAPINRGDIERWSQKMYLTDAQKDQFRILHESYIDRESRVHWKHIQPLWNRSADISRRGRPSSHTILAEEFADLVKNELPRAVNKLVITDDLLFNEFEIYLEEYQLPLLRHIKAERKRQRYNRRKSRYPGGDVDLPLLLWKLYRMDLDLTGEQSAALMLLTNEYDESLTHLFKKRLDAILDLSIKGSLLNLRLQSSDKDSVKELWDMRKRLNRKLIRAESQIHDQNVRYLNLMIEVLPEAKANGLAGTFNQLVYNSIYPDPTDTTSLFQSVIVIDELTSEQHDSLRAIEIMIESQHTILCNQMVRRFLEWREFHGIEWGYPPGALDEYKMDMFVLHNKRKENAQLAILLINATILPEQKTDRLSATTATLVSWMQEFEFNPDKRLSRR